MAVGVQFTGTVPPGATRRWFTHSWPATAHVAWNVVSTSPSPAGAQVDWSIDVQRQSPTLITYFVDIRNLSAAPVNIEARYAIMS